MDSQDDLSQMTLVVNDFKREKLISCVIQIEFPSDVEDCEILFLIH